MKIIVIVSLLLVAAPVRAQSLDALVQIQQTPGSGGAPLVRVVTDESPMAVQIRHASPLFPSLALLAGSGADLATTLVALHTVPGATEGNPILSHGGDTGLVAVKLGTTAALVFAVHQLMPQHPVLARCIGYGGGMALMGVAARNATLR